MEFLEFLKAVLFGIVEGITEWLPVSSTGHIILFKDLLNPNMTEGFYDLFEMVIQLGAILAVLVLFFRMLNPFSRKKDQLQKKDTWWLWLKVIIAVIPSAVIGLLIDDPLDEWLRGTPVLSTDLNTFVVAVMLIIYGVLFILVERKRDRSFSVCEVGQLTLKTAVLIGAFQCLSIIPGTSRSGATILGAILLGVARPVGAEFSFFLAIPTMLGASAKNTLEYALDCVETGMFPSTTEIGMLIVGCVVSFLVSLAVIKALMDFVRRHSFASFGIYRIVVGVLMIVYFVVRSFV